MIKEFKILNLPIDKFNYIFNNILFDNFKIIEIEKTLPLKRNSKGMIEYETKVISQEEFRDWYEKESKNVLDYVKHNESVLNEDDKIPLADFYIEFEEGYIDLLPTTGTIYMKNIEYSILNNILEELINPEDFEQLMCYIDTNDLEYFQKVYKSIYEMSKLKNEYILVQQDLDIDSNFRGESILNVKDINHIYLYEETSHFHFIKSNLIKLDIPKGSNGDFILSTIHSSELIARIKDKIRGKVIIGDLENLNNIT